MARLLSEFFTPKALSRTAYLKKFPKGPLVIKIAAVEMQEVKKGGERNMAIEVDKLGVWLSVNKTNADRLAIKFGQDIDEWIGKKVKLGENPEGFQGKHGFLMDPA